MVARMLWPATLCLLGLTTTLTAAMRDGKAPATGDAGDWSDAFEDSECDDAEDDVTYWTWLAQREAIDGQPTTYRLPRATLVVVSISANSRPNASTGMAHASKNSASLSFLVSRSLWSSG